MSSKVWFHVKDKHVVTVRGKHHSVDVIEYPQRYGLTKDNLAELDINLTSPNTYNGSVLWMMMQNGWTRVSTGDDISDELNIEAVTVRDVQLTLRFFMKDDLPYDEVHYELRYGPGFYDFSGTTYLSGNEIELFVRYGKKTKSVVAAFRESVLLEAEKIDILKKYNSIAIDYDGTLVDGPNSTLLHKFIKDNPDKTYFIVTFRTNGGHLINKMNQQYPDSPGKEYFKQVVTMNSRLELQYIEDTRQRVERRIPKSEGLTRAEDLYTTWKGLMCKRLGTQVLIDDDKMLHIRGMEKYNINWYDPDEFYESALQESVQSSPLFHGTSYLNLLRIWISNKIEPFTSHVIDTKDIQGVSVSRDFKYAKLRADQKVNLETPSSWWSEGEVEDRVGDMEVEIRGHGAVIELDKTKLALTHKFIPVVWDPAEPNESEEFIPHGIKSAKNYITKIYIDKDNFERFTKLLPENFKVIANELLASGKLSHLPSMGK